VHGWMGERLNVWLGEWVSGPGQARPGPGILCREVRRWASMVKCGWLGGQGSPPTRLLAGAVMACPREGTVMDGWPAYLQGVLARLW